MDSVACRAAYVALDGPPRENSSLIVACAHLNITNIIDTYIISSYQLDTISSVNNAEKKV